MYRHWIHDSIDCGLLIEGKKKLTEDGTEVGPRRGLSRRRVASTGERSLFLKHTQRFSHSASKTITKKSLLLLSVPPLSSARTTRVPADPNKMIHWPAANIQFFLQFLYDLRLFGYYRF